MSRLLLTFNCQGCNCVATLDTAPGTTGLLIISGGNEIRAGAFSGQARIAAEIAQAGFPVFRFDRRGIGDSDGENRGFRCQHRDIEAALEAFRAMAPRMEHVIAWGNCDAASALMLIGGDGFDGLVLSNPWAVEEDHKAQPPAALRSRYLEKLRNPRELARLVTGKINLAKLMTGLKQAALPSSAPSSLTQEMAAGLEKFHGPVTILLAERDRTAQLFDMAWNKQDTRVVRCPEASHAFVEPDAHNWLLARLLEALRN